MALRSSSRCCGLTAFVTQAVWTHMEPCSESERRRRVARAMAGLLRCPDLLTAEQMVPSDGERYRTVLLWSDAVLDLSLLALVWKPGQQTAIHDHHAACIVGLYQGAERETRYERTAPGADTVFPVGQTTMRAGAVSVVTPGTREIHRVEAIAPAPAITVSLHFYEVDVTRKQGGSSIRQCFREATAAGSWGATRSLAAVH